MKQTGPDAFRAVARTRDCNDPQYGETPGEALAAMGEYLEGEGTFAGEVFVGEDEDEEDDE